jgi:hypothetical protein
MISAGGMQDGVADGIAKVALLKWYYGIAKVALLSTLRGKFAAR